MPYRREVSTRATSRGTMRAGGIHPEACEKLRPHREIPESTAREPLKPKSKKATARAKPHPGNYRLFTLDVSLVGGPMTESFARNHPLISRTIEIRGDQTLADLHRAIFRAFDREEEHMYEFQIGGKRPMDPKARRYVLPMAMDPFGEKAPAGDVERTAIESLGLKLRQAFGYWFDFGDDWWHRVEVRAIGEAARRGKLPRVTQRVGASPPQYVDWDEEA
jgi:hypothetical protein